MLLTLLSASAASGITTIDNTAKASYSIGPVPKFSISNAVTIRLRTPSTLEYLKYAPLSPDAEMTTVKTTMHTGATGALEPLPNPVPVGSTTPLDISGPVPLVRANVYHHGEPIFLMLTDLDQNIDPTIEETIILVLECDNGEKETLVLREMGPDTGVFIGYIQSTTGAAVRENGLFSVYSNCKIIATYTDVVDGTDTFMTVALVDPYGVVFDSASGEPVNGATVVLIDAATGLPADVYGDDGVSSYPSTVISGATATDGSGVVYTFPPGGYRFPFINLGNYRLDITPPPGYRAPSTVSNAALQQLPNSPFAIKTGSKGEVFAVNQGPAIQIDIPADPSPQLYVTKKAGKTVVAVGDFLQYRITVENTNAYVVAGVQAGDRLPLGFRYRKGSTKIDGGASPDPAISGDGRSLTFNIGTMAAGQTAAITYVVEISAGAKKGKAVNTASATGNGGAKSNTASTTVKVREDLFGSKSIIMGQVLVGCDDAKGKEGIRIYLEDGTYVVTDGNGKYHFEGLKPGTHVVQLDLFTIPKDYELITCEENDRFAGVSHSQFVDLRGGTMWRADFYIAPKPVEPPPAVEPPAEEPPVEKRGSVAIELNSTLSDKGIAGQAEGKRNVAFEAPIHVQGDVPLMNLRLSVMLPDGVEYVAGSSRLGNDALTEPSAMENVLTYRLGDVAVNWEGRIRFDAEMPVEGDEGEFATSALLTFDTWGAKSLRTPLVDNSLAREEEMEAHDFSTTIRPHFISGSADLSGEDKAQLDAIVDKLKGFEIKSIRVVGHTDPQRISKRLQKTYPDNYALSMARAKSVAEYLSAPLKLSPSQATTDGKGPDEPIASNDTAEGWAKNRRVELKIEAAKRTKLYEVRNTKDRSGIKAVELKELMPSKKQEQAPVEEKKTDPRAAPDFDAAWINAAKPGFEWLWPYEGFYPSTPSVKIAVKHAPSGGVKLFLNGAEVESLFLDGVETSSDEKVAVSFWSGIHLGEGDNHFEVVEYGGGTERRIKRTIHYSGLPVKAFLVPERSRLFADGKTPPAIAVRLVDKDGHPAREKVTGEYSLAPPYLSLQKAKDMQRNPLSMSIGDRDKYTVGEDGIALIELQPTSKTGEAVLRFNLVSGEKEVRAWLAPEVRDWILVGLAEGTAGYNTVSGNMESIEGSGVDDEYYSDGRLAFFAKGMIKGKWLLTAAYDSDKNGIKKNDSLHGAIDPDDYYMLYGDAASQQYDAASARALYVKVEREKFYALFGDYDTGLTVTELSRYSRSLNGLKSEMKGGRFDFNVFASDTNQAFVKDELRGDGTSGLYRLTRRNIVINSESIALETRDRFKSEVIISSRQLTRHIDYGIDYDEGSIFFKFPVYGRDENFNPIYIVVDYESYDDSDTSYNYGGRGAARLFDKKLEMGATYIHEGRVGGEGDLGGVDATLKFNERTKVKAEFASTDTNFYKVDSRGSAYLAEVSHGVEKLDGRAYVRQQDEDFGLGQQKGSETGTRKFGFDGTYRINEPVSLRTEAYRQYNLATDAERDMAEMQVRYAGMKYDLLAGLRHAEDSLGNGDKNASEQIILGSSFRTMNGRLVFRLMHDQSIAGNNENGDFPTRTTMGADYRFIDAATVFIAREFTYGETEDTDMTRIGLMASPWTGGQLSSTVEQQNGDGSRVFSVIGLKQTVQVTRKWSVDAGLDRSSTLRHRRTYSFNTNVPPASGGSDFTAMSLGAAYREEKWSWTGRAETRDSDYEDKRGIFTGIYGEVREGLGLAAGLQMFTSKTSLGASKLNGNLRSGLAYRPKKTAWIVLDRLDYIFEEQDGGGFDYDNWRIVNNLNVNRRINRRAQLSLQYGAKYVNETIDDRDYSGYTDLTGIEGRYDLTKKLDVGLAGSVLHSWETDQIKYGSGLSVGYNFVKNVWVSAGYNFTGFRDRDFSKANYTGEGPFVKFRMKFDQGTAKDAVKWLSGQ